MKTLNAVQVIDHFDALARTCRQAMSGAQLARHMKQVHVDTFFSQLASETDADVLSGRIADMVEPAIKSAPLSGGLFDQAMSELMIARMKNALSALLIPFIYRREKCGETLSPLKLKDALRHWIATGAVQESLREAPHGDVLALGRFIRQKCESEGLKGEDAMATVRYSVMFPLAFALEPLVMIEENALVPGRMATGEADAPDSTRRGAVEPNSGEDDQALTAGYAAFTG